MSALESVAGAVVDSDTQLESETAAAEVSFVADANAALAQWTETAAAQSGRPSGPLPYYNPDGDDTSNYVSAR